MPILRGMLRVEVKRPLSWIMRLFVVSAPPVVGCGVAVLTAQLLHYTPSLGPLDFRSKPGQVAGARTAEGALVTLPTPRGPALNSASSSLGPVATTAGDEGTTTVSGQVGSAGATSTTMPPPSTAAVTNTSMPPGTTAHPPEVTSDRVTAKQSATIHIDVLDNDFDVDGDLDLLSVSVIASPVGPGPDVGSVSVRTRNGRNEIDYRAPSAPGDFTFSYQVCDSRRVCGSANVIVSVTFAPDGGTRPGRP